MADIASKTDKFLKAIEKYAEEQRTKIRSEAETFKEKELEKAEEDGIHEAYVLIQRKMAEIKTEISASLSKQEAASRKELFIRRNEIMNEVFAKAEKKLQEFVKTEKYKPLLLDSVKQMSSVLNGNVTLYVRKEDLNLSAEIQKTFGKDCTVEADDKIQIGGIIGKSFSMGLIADESLDAKLAEQKEWFCSHSGLRVTE
ncbi:MAG: V-type ATP synthase subunit E [Acutalibacteraceae bacterium]